MNCYFVSRRLWLRDKSIVLPGGVEVSASHSTHSEPASFSSPVLSLPVYFWWTWRTGRMGGNSLMASRAMNLSDELCHFMRGQGNDLSSHLETQFMILTKFHTLLEQKWTCKPHPVCYSPLFWIALETQQLMHRCVMRPYYLARSLLGAGEKKFFKQGQHLVCPLKPLYATVTAYKHHFVLSFVF